MAVATLNQTSTLNKDNTKSAKLLAHNVRGLRFKQRISVSELARRSGLSRQILYNVENGTSNLRMDSLEKLASALEVGVLELLG